ncbi:MAG: DUF4832 domain-containing protein, partial [Rubrobacter sp.]
PQEKRDIYRTAKPLGPADAFAGTNRARTGHHNDCFVADVDDWGTYWPLDPPSLEAQKKYLDRDNRYVVQSGETCNFNPPRSDCPDALEDLERMRWSSINAGYQPRVLQGWREQGCMPQVKRRLGYRFRLTRAVVPESVAAGSVLQISLTVKNDGFATPYNPRDAEIILRNRRTGEEASLPINQDPRLWFPGPARTIPVKPRVPADLNPGTYDAFLNLPDPAPRLEARPAYSIRLANEGLWEPATGYNRLKAAVRVR